MNTFSKFKEDIADRTKEELLKLQKAIKAEIMYNKGMEFFGHVHSRRNLRKMNAIIETKLTAMKNASSSN